MDENLKSMLKQVRESAEVLAERTGKAASVAAEKAGKTAGNVLESTKLNLQLFDLNGEIEGLYKQIGRTVYEMHRGAEVEQEDVQVCLSRIDELQARIDQLKNRPKDGKATRTCPGCGRVCSEEDIFCRVCGTQL